MKTNRSNKFALVSALTLAGCGIPSGDEQSSRFEQGPWYEVGTAEAPGEPWPREVLEEGTGPISTAGSVVFVTFAPEPINTKNQRGRDSFLRANEHKFILWLGNATSKPSDQSSRPNFSVGDDRLRSSLISLKEGSQIRINVPHNPSDGELPLNGMRGFDSESPEYHQWVNMGEGTLLATIHKVCEAKLYAREGVFHEIGLKSHGERGFTLTRTWRAQWGKLEGTCHTEPFKRETGPNSIEEAHSRGAQIDRGQ